MEDRVTSDAQPKNSEGSSDLEVFIQHFEDSQTNTSTERAASEKARDYTSGDQWTPAEKATLIKRKQPVITDNRTKDKVDYLLGMERRTRTDPRAWPRNPSEDDKSKAQAATDAIRYVWDAARAQQVKSRAFENLIVEGVCAVEVCVEKNGQANPKIPVRHIRWDRFYRDPYSMELDFSDAQYMGIVVWMDFEAAKQKYPTLADSFDKMLTNFDASDTTGDKPRWIDSKRKRVQILEHYYRKQGDWWRVVFSKAGIIEQPAKSYYKNSLGETLCPILAASLYVDRDGRRVGVVERYIGLQDEVNKRRSKSLHLLSTKQVVYETGAVGDAEKLRREVARPDGVIEHAPNLKLEVIENRDLATGQFQLLQDALNSFSVVGATAALQGNSGSISGRAKELDAQGGSIQLGAVSDTIRDLQYRICVAIWQRVQQSWTAEQWIRVTDDENNIKWVGLNVFDPKTNTVLRPIEVDVDIVIDEAPDTVTLQQEQWTQLTELAANGVPIPPKLLIQASSLKDKARLIDEIEGRGENGDGIPMQVRQQIEQITQAQQQVAQAQQAQQQQLEAEKQQLEAEKQKVLADKAALAAEQKILQLDVKLASATVKEQGAGLDAKLKEIAVAEKTLQQQLGSAKEILAAHQEAAQAKLDAQSETVAVKTDGGSKLSEVYTKVQEMVAAHTEQMAEQQRQTLEMVSTTVSQLAAAIAALQQNPPPRTVRMQGPSGNVYEARIQ